MNDYITKDWSKVKNKDWIKNKTKTSYVKHRYLETGKRYSVAMIYVNEHYPYSDKSNGYTCHVLAKETKDGEKALFSFSETDLEVAKFKCNVKLAEFGYNIDITED